MATITGTAGNDTLLGTAEDDAVEGLAGDDFIDGGPGNDLLTPGDGADTVVLAFGNGRDGVSSQRGASDIVRLIGPLIDVAYIRDDVRSADLGFRIEYEVSRLFTLVDGTSLSEYRSAHAALNFFESQETGRLKIVGSGGGAMTGTDDNELLSGNFSGDHMDGSGGDDVLYANEGADTMLGGDGNDYLSAGREDGRDDVFDGGHGLNTVSYSGVGGGVTIDLGRQVAIGPAIGRDIVVNFQSAVGSLGDDVLVGNADSFNTLRGYWGNDYLYGLGGPDVLIGGHGNDVLIGDTGNDALHGDEGRDHLYGGADTNGLYGGDDVDVLISQGTNDTLAGGNGDDYLYAYGDGTTHAQGGAGNDIFVMQSGLAVADGDEGQDYFYMGTASDVMRGGGGVDVLLGGGGYDLFDGGAGTDYLFLGAGSSTVVFHSYSGADVVTGFKAEGTRHVIRFEGRVSRISATFSRRPTTSTAMR